MSESDQATRNTTAAGRYAALEMFRSPALERAREASRLTIPGLLPPAGSSDASVLPQPFQSLGARGVNNLAAKILLALFPPGTSFFRLTMDDFVVQELAAKAGGGVKGEDARAEFEAALGKIERAVVNRLEQTGARPVLFEFIKHLLTCGNAMLQVLDGGRLRMHRFDQFVVARDTEGTVLEIVLKEVLSPLTLPKAAHEVFEAQSKTNETDEGKSAAKTVDLFTHVRRQEDGSWTVYSEILGTRIPDSEGAYPKDKSPWIPARFTRIDGENYGRGMVEEYMGDLYSLESLAEAIVRFASVAAKILFLLDPNGVTQKKDLEKPSGAIVLGNAKDVSVLSLEKFADFRVAKETHDGIAQRLGEAFLLGSSVRRDAERVTAEEIRVIAAELEQGLGGFYSVLSQDVQLPLIARVIYVMEKENKLPKLPKDVVSPQIVTGVEALGRNTDLQRLQTLGAFIKDLFGEQAVNLYLKPNPSILRIATALGIDVTGLVNSAEEIAAQQQQAAAQEMVGKLGPQMIKGQQEAQASQAEQPPQ